MTYGFCASWQQQPALSHIKSIRVRTSRQPYSYGCLRVFSHVFFLPIKGEKSDTTAPPITPMHHSWSNPIKSMA